jgi:YEATS family
MAIQIKQDSNYLGNDYWDWWAKIDGSNKELDNIDRVTWHLHPSFSSPIVISNTRENGFKLETRGWGTFELEAIVHLKTKVELKLTHELELFYPENTKEPTESDPKSTDSSIKENTSKKSLFMSYYSNSFKQLIPLIEKLRQKDFEILSGAISVSPGAPFETMVTEAISNAGCHIVYLYELELNRWLSIELSVSLQLKKPILVVCEGNFSKTALKQTFESIAPDISSIQFAIAKTQTEAYKQILAFAK